MLRKNEIRYANQKRKLYNFSQNDKIFEIIINNNNNNNKNVKVQNTPARMCRIVDKKNDDEVE